MTVLHLISGLNQGGAESALFRLVTSRSGAVTHVVVSMMDLGVYGQPLRDAGVEVHTLGMRPGRLKPSGLWQLWKLMRRVRPDAVQTWMYHADLVGGVVARLTGCSNVIWGIVSFNLGPGMVSRRTKAVAWCAAVMSHILPRHIVFCSAAAMAVHARLGYATRKFRVIHLGFDPTVSHDHEGRESLRRKYSLGADEFLLGCVARWDPQKDHVTLLRALAIASTDRPVKCLLVGNRITHENPELEAQVVRTATAGVVTLCGRVEDVLAVMGAIDVHVLSSLGEGFPNVLAEAMLCGTPCIATDVGDVRYVLGETGWVVPPGEPVALARAIADAVTAKADVPGWKARQEACRSRIREEFGLDGMVSAYQGIWAESLNAR